MTGVARAEFSGTIRILAFQFNGPVREYRVADAKGTPLDDNPLPLSATQLSPALGVHSRELVFLPPQEKTPAGGNAQKPPTTATIPADAVHVTLPDGVESDYYLIFLPGASGGAAPYRVQALAISPKDFKSGSHAILNYTDAEIGCILGKSKVLVGSCKCSVIPAGKDEGLETFGCYEKKQGEEWSARPFYSGRLVIQKGVRQLLIISRNSETGDAQFRGVTDYL